MRHSAHRLALTRRQCLALAALGLGGGAARAWPGPASPAGNRPAVGPRQAARVRPLPPPAPEAPLPLPEAVSRMLDASGLPRDHIGMLVAPLPLATPPARPPQVPGRSAATPQRPPKEPPPLLQLNDAQPLQMASVAKLITTLAALDLLGPQYRWRTEARLLGPLHEGRLLGDLAIVGGGDALLTAQDVLAWFIRMREQGLTEVLGDIVLDHSQFRLDEADLARTPEPAPERPHHAWPTALWVQAGGWVPPPAPPQPARRTRPGAAPPPVLPPALDDGMARMVLALWRESGLKLRGRVIDRRETSRLSPVMAGGDHGPATTWSEHLSPPLAQAMREINKRSDNTMSRQLMMSLAPGFPARPATLAGARLRLGNWLRLQGVADGEAQVDSGSGLARTERATPRALVQLLRLAHQHPHAEVFVDSLPVAGLDGTLYSRFADSPARGQARLKTGTLMDTKALAGYVRDRSGRPHAVALLAQHPPGADRATALLESIVDWVARQG